MFYCFFLATFAQSNICAAMKYITLCTHIRLFLTILFVASYFTTSNSHQVNDKKMIHFHDEWVKYLTINTE